MDDEKSKKRKKEPEPPAMEPAGPEAAFDVWLQERLHQLYDSVTEEPIPPELAQLIEDDKRRRSK